MPLTARARLLALDKQSTGTVNLHVGPHPGAIEHGVHVTFVRSKYRDEEEREKLLAPRTIEALLIPDAREWSKPPKINGGCSS